VASAILAADVRKELAATAVAIAVAVAPAAAVAAGVVPVLPKAKAQ
jgi:hypothetical protein